MNVLMVNIDLFDLVAQFLKTTLIFFYTYKKILCNNSPLSSLTGLEEITFLFIASQTVGKRELNYRKASLPIKYILFSSRKTFI